MNIKINPETPRTGEEIGVSRSAGIAAPDRSTRRAGRIEGSGGDVVEISGLSAGIADALAAGEVRAAGRVAELAKLYSRGEYRTDSAALSAAIVDRAIGNGPQGGGE